MANGKGNGERVNEAIDFVGPKMYNTDTEYEQYFEDVGMPEEWRQGILNLFGVSQNPVVEVHSPKSLAKFFQGRGVPRATHGILERYPEIGELFLQGIEPTQEIMDKILAGKSESKRTSIVQKIIKEKKKAQTSSESYKDIKDVEGYVHEGIEPFVRKNLIKLASGYQEAVRAAKEKRIKSADDNAFDAMKEATNEYKIGE